jgi:hypothetical protein
MKLTFHDDGTGGMEEWGFDHHHLDPAYVNEPSFCWRTPSDRRIEITHRGNTYPVSYDFKTTENEYGIKELRLFELGLKPDEHGDVGFWLSPFSLVFRGPEEPGNVTIVPANLGKFEGDMISVSAPTHGIFLRSSGLR